MSTHGSVPSLHEYAVYAQRLGSSVALPFAGWAAQYGRAASPAASTVRVKAVRRSLERDHVWDAIQEHAPDFAKQLDLNGWREPLLQPRGAAEAPRYVACPTASAAAGTMTSSQLAYLLQVPQWHRAQLGLPICKGREFELYRVDGLPTWSKMNEGRVSDTTVFIPPDGAVSRMDIDAHTVESVDVARHEWTMRNGSVRTRAQLQSHMVHPELVDLSLQEVILHTPLGEL